MNSYFVEFSRPDMPAKDSSYFGITCPTAANAIDVAVGLCMAAGDDEPEARRKHFSTIKARPVWCVGYTPGLRMYAVSIIKSKYP